MDSFSDFIVRHQDDNVDRLLFSQGKWPDIDMVKAVNTILCRRKLRSKLPTWYADTTLVYPERLPAEQCSSEETAMYKAGLARRLLEEALPEKEAYRIADLTGGMGADSWAFSKIAGEVMYNEMNPVLADAASHNFRQLGASGIRVSCKAVSATSSETHSSPSELLGDFAPDMIFLDPARRAEDGSKVFLIEDCSPDILTLKKELLEISPVVMIKLSPMADISMVAEKLGRQCREIHVISSGGECKELIVVMEREWNGDYSIVAVENIGKGTYLEFTREEETEAAADLVSGHDIAPETTQETYLFEPGKSVLKAGAFNLLCQRFGLKKFGRSTHLYLTSDSSTAETLSGLGKVFLINDILQFNNRNIKDVGAACPDADVTARNMPVTSDDLKSRLYGKKKKGSAPENRIRRHIFGVKSDLLGNMLIICTRTGIHPHT